METAIATIAGHPVELVCAGRTDAGVHAAVQVAHFDTDARRPLTAWVRGVNTYLPDSIAVNWAAEVRDDFHARFSATSRRYRYLLVNRPVRTALLNGRVGWLHSPLDVEQMRAAAGYLLGEHDFSAFRGADCQAKTPVRELRVANIVRHDDWVAFEFEANAFLHHMIRNLVGALVHIGKGGESPDWIQYLLAMRDRKLAPPTFSSAGLYLCGVEYPVHFGLPGDGKIQAPLFLPA